MLAGPILHGCAGRNRLTPASNPPWPRHTGGLNIRLDAGLGQEGATIYLNMSTTISVDQIHRCISRNRWQYLVYIGLSMGVAGATRFVQLSNPLHFRRFLGGVDPFIAMVLVGVAGLFLLSFLLSRGWFSIHERADFRSLGWTSGIAALLASLAIALDLTIVFPADMNIPFPASLLFYPSIGFLVEILFHVLPLSLLLFLLTSFFKNLGAGKAIGISILVVSLLEPTYQAIAMASSGHYPRWAVLYVGFHIFLINSFQLLIFKRYDFFSMYAFRLAYYLVWHVAWGYLRLQVLF